MEVKPIPYPADTRARGWRFEVDMEKVKASDTWLRAKTGEIRGALMLLWGEAWQQTPCGSLPADDELVALIIDMPDAKFAKCRAVLMRGWWQAVDGRLYHDTIVERVLAMLEKRAKDAERSANRRARQAGPAVDPAGVTGASRVTPAGVPPEFDTKHQAPSTSLTPSVEGVAARKVRGVKKCPESFVLTDDMRGWAAENEPGLTATGLERETAKFRDHTFSRAITDWPGAWRNWIRRAMEGRRPVLAAAPQQSFAERDREAGMRRWEEMTGQVHPDRGQSSGVVIDMPATPQLVIGGRS